MIKEPKTSEVPGYSSRFGQLLDLAGIPPKRRYTWGSTRFNKSFNTFKGWCTRNVPPRTYAEHILVIQAILERIPGSYDDRAVLAWLLVGDAVKHPFEPVHEVCSVCRSRAPDA